MPQPENVGPADFERWNAKLIVQVAADPRSAFVLHGDDELKTRAWYTGEWLGEQLSALKCPGKLITEICFALGQRTFLCPDPWATAAWALDEYRDGRHEVPGEELAQRVISDYPEEFSLKFGSMIAAIVGNSHRS